MTIRSILILSFSSLLILTSASPAEQLSIGVSGAWIREVLPGQNVTAAYLVIENHSDQPDVLTGGSCECAGSVEIHKMIHSGGRMKMERVRQLEVASKERIEFKPGGYHLMLFALKEPLKDGQKVTLVLTFEREGELRIDAPVKALEGKKNAHSH